MFRGLAPGGMTGWWDRAGREEKSRGTQERKANGSRLDVKYKHVCKCLPQRTTLLALHHFLFLSSVFVC